jgi:ketosteroid isomerase-like protein
MSILRYETEVTLIHELWIEYASALTANQPVMDLFDTEMTISPEDVRILGDCAYSHGSYKQAMTPKEGGEPISNAGRFLTILEKQANGSWKIAIACFNTSQLPKFFR